ncbi:MAG TPA: glutamate 5-kinase [Bacteriovoracaceae bacterium]|nr:glutamate 5-kinase [Bacteriovoracaceae bacterium]
MRLRKELAGVKRIIIKVGSNVITAPNGKCDLRRMRIIVEDICELIEQGIEVVLVSSGAINVGKAFLDTYLPNRIELQQSASAIGQPKLIYKYTNLFEESGRICSQILLTHEDFKDHNRFLNAKKTIEVLLKNHVIPILNENDTISFSDISVGDNDHLAAQAAQMLDADLLLIITSANGLYDKDPSEEGAQLIKYVPYGEDLLNIDMQSKTTSGRGGMKSKIDAISKATEVGIKCLIGSKNNDRIIMDLLMKDLGTLFGVNEKVISERKAWLISTRRHNCFIDVDHSTYEALISEKPLYADGIISASGAFSKGDCVDLRYKGKPFAVGLCDFAKDEVTKLDEKCEVIRKTNLVINQGSN